MSQLDTIHTLINSENKPIISMETPSNNNSLNSLNSNGTTSQPSLDMEMLLADSSSSSSYTSLKDLIIMSPSAGEGRKQSWREIPLKDPLVQHAAWAYLQPMCEDNNNDQDNRLFVKLKNKICQVFGCFNEVVLGMSKAWFVNEDQIEEHKQEEEKQEKEEEEDCLYDCLD